MPYTVSGDGGVGYWKIADGSFIANPSNTRELTFTTDVANAAVVCLYIYDGVYSYLKCVVGSTIVSLQYDKEKQMFMWVDGHFQIDKYKLHSKSGTCTAWIAGTELTGQLV